MNNITIRYLPSAERDLAWGLAVSCVGFQRVDPGETYPPQSHPASYCFNTSQGRVLDEYQIIYIVKGEGTFRSEHGGEHHVKAGDVEMLFPGERHTYYPAPDTGWEEYWIGFKGPNIDSRVSNGFFSVEHPVFHVGIRENIIHVYRDAIESVRNMSKGYQQMLAGCVNMLLGYIYTLDGVDSATNEQAVLTIQQAVVYINDHFREDIHPEDVAAHLNCGYSRFRKLFQEHTGLSPYQHILRLRIHRSKELLAYTHKSLSEIAYDVGFNNSLYFSTAFKRIEKISPKQYRQQSSFTNDL